MHEAADKFTQQTNLRKGIKLHLNGLLQSNKVKDAAAIFNVIQTADRDKIARKIADEITKQN